MCKLISIISIKTIFSCYPNINNTVKNIRLANEVIEKSDNPQEIENMMERNKRRKVALDNMRCEIKEEARARENSMK